MVTDNLTRIVDHEGPNKLLRFFFFYVANTQERSEKKYMQSLKADYVNRQLVT